MMGIQLYDHQLEALDKLRNGSILCGDTGLGKSRTAIAYYFTKNGGKLNPYGAMDIYQDLYIITTARKRDELDWEKDLGPFLLYPRDKNENPTIIIDSWNKIEKYSSVKGAFFIFDEQRVGGSGKWAKTFIKIAQANNWILLSATPGDTWMDYASVFIANGYFKSYSDFRRQHVIYKPFTTYPVVSGYRNETTLKQMQNYILVPMNYVRPTISHHEYVTCFYDREKYRRIQKERWDIWNNEPIENASELCYALRKATNESSDRLAQLLAILDEHSKAIVFYNFDYELDILRSAPYNKGTAIAEWNGHKHEPIPDTDKWVYLVQYTAGSEGWNCIQTDTLIFYSQSYSYKTTHQAAGRIDRLNTPFVDLYYFHLVSKSPIDIAIGRALRDKKEFNIRGFAQFN